MFGGYVWVDASAVYRHGRPGGPYCAPGLGRAEAMWPCPEGALVCEETDEPLNGVTCPKAPSGLAHSHHAPPRSPSPTWSRGHGYRHGSQTAVSATVSSLPLFPRLCKSSPRRDLAGGVSLQPCSTRFQKAQTWRSPYALRAQLWPPAPPSALYPGPCGIAARPRVFVP